MVRDEKDIKVAILQRKFRHGERVSATNASRVLETSQDVWILESRM